MPCLLPPSPTSLSLSARSFPSYATVPCDVDLSTYTPTALTPASNPGSSDLSYEAATATYNYVSSIWVGREKCAFWVPPNGTPTWRLVLLRGVRTVLARVQRLNRKPSCCNAGPTVACASRRQL